jgi:NADH:ubiquinone oxidoreductase subunit 5 (subunit L)/multisubunit Na+/H+ antiporter MnhA subunit
MLAAIIPFLFFSADPESKNFTILLIASEIGVTLLVFYGFYLVFNTFNKKMKSHKKENPELFRGRPSSED